MSDERLVPVNPGRDEGGRIKSLLPFVGARLDDALPYPEALTPEDLAERTTIVNFFQTSARTAATLGIMDALATSSDYLSEAAVFEILVGTHKIRAGDVTGCFVRETFWGSSIRIVMRVKARDSKASGSFGMLAASVELGSAEVEYEVKSVGGVSTELLAIALEGMPLFGTLDFDAYTRFTAAADDIAQRLMAQVSPRAVPVAVKLRYHPAKESTSEAISMRYAMVSIAHLLPLADALRAAPQGFEPLVIHEAYQKVLGDTSAPLEAHAEKARSWLNA
jgi:hypothetical protein